MAIGTVAVIAGIAIGSFLLICAAAVVGAYLPEDDDS